MAIINNNIISLQELIDQFGGEDGAQGIQGVQGIPGLQGLQGARGAQGLQGYRGLQGVQGTQGPKGYTGFRGESGIQGAPGVQGSKGLVGVQGAKGAAGVQGMGGMQGMPGLQGYKGIQGIQGLKGTPGLQGAMGVQGAAGLQGIPGCQGVQGTQGTTGLQGIRGFNGATGLQGLFGCQGVQGVPGTQGLQGTQGPRGHKGAVGLQGAMGVQGIQGPRGIQGLQGYTGHQGDSGESGLQGVQGVQGATGLQGFQGFRGAAGQQGYRGMAGLQGLQGLQGATGLQGIRGCRGLQGPDGVNGVQGVQGPKGKRGPKGYMGYQGDSGEAGIQGLQGEVGSVWFDGIRLNGYNTKLYIYDRGFGRFVTTNDQNEQNYMKVRKGAVIKLVFNEGCLDALRAGTIPVMSLENSQSVLTNYPAYYSENVPISSVVSSHIPNNAILEFTFYDGGWYYSGGSISLSSSTDAVLTANIKVKGVTVGNIINGETLEAGTTMQEIFEHMLVKVTPAKATAPKPVPQTPSGNAAPANNGTVEVGNAIGFTMSTRYEDGYYSSSDTSLYPASEFNQINGCTGGKLPAECELVSKNYFRDGSSVSPTVTYASVPEGDYAYLCSVTYKASNVVPKDSDGEGNTGVVIQAGTSPRVANFSFKARYKVFYGNTPADPSNQYRERFTSKEQLQTLGFGWLPVSGSTEPLSISSSEGSTAFVLAIPSTYRITATSTVNGIPVNVDEKWVYRNSVQYVNGSVETTYKVYVMHALIPQTYTNIIITKQS